MTDLMLNTRLSALAEHITKVRGLLDATNVRAQALTELQSMLDDTVNGVTELGEKLDELRNMALRLDDVPSDTIIEFHQKARPLLDDAVGKIRYGKNRTLSMKRDSLASRMPDLLFNKRLNESLIERTTPCTTNAKAIEGILNQAALSADQLESAWSNWKKLSGDTQNLF